MKKVISIGIIVIALVFVSGCINENVIPVDYDDNYGLHYAGTISEKNVNITITGTLDGYPLTGTIVGPTKNATVTYTVHSLYNELIAEDGTPDFASTTYQDISHIAKMDDIKYELLTSVVTTEINFTNTEYNGDPGTYIISGTLTQTRNNEPYYNLSMNGENDLETMKYVGSIIGPESNVTMYVNMGSPLGSLIVTVHKDLNTPEGVYLDNISMVGTGMFEGIGDDEMPGFGGITAIVMMVGALLIMRRRT